MPKTTREPTRAALCAKAVRAELKANFPTIKFKVTSSNFSMGNSVDVKWTNGPSSKQVDQVIKKYQYGHFDGMIDCYEHSNTRDDIPQAKFVSGSREFSEEVLNNCAEVIAKDYGVTLPSDPSQHFDFQGQWYSRYALVWRHCRDLDFTNKNSIKSTDNGFETVNK